MERKAKNFFPGLGGFSGRSKELKYISRETFMCCRAICSIKKKEREHLQIVFIFGKKDCSCVTFCASPNLTCFLCKILTTVY